MILSKHDCKGCQTTLMMLEPARLAAAVLLDLSDAWITNCGLFQSLVKAAADCALRYTAMSSR